MDTERPGRKGWRWLLLVAVLLVIAIVVAPTLISRTSLRNAVLQSILGNANLQVSSASASFGWGSPMVIDDLKLLSSDRSVDIEIAQLRTERSWVQLWWSRPEIGRIEVDRPQVRLVVGDEDPSSEELDETTGITACPTFSVDLTDGTLQIRNENESEPVVDAAGINIRLHTEQRPEGSMLLVEPISLADREVLSEEVCQRGLQLVAPELAEEVGIEGEYSIDLTTMELALGAVAPDADKSVIEGVVTLHEVTAGLKNDVTRRVVMMSAELLELGEVPDKIRVTENAELAFRLTRGQIEHEGMVVLFPEDPSSPVEKERADLGELSIRSSGSVGWDERMDLVVELRVPAVLLNKTELARQLAEHPLKILVKGTVEEPSFHLPDDQVWMTTIARRMSSPDVLPEERELSKRIQSVFADLQAEQTD